ncbi:carbamate kinase [Garciella nitratireducens]|uniref:Carbamate kinase n=1 Tax=Garciella nitratireducens DSM 15102 TaxID=1121911 RepID=A0A1T4MWA1_9FIRM|nr:carbamate kinase [Garciella nitratireducens]SJZ71302.1 carbamate kinase [Garciella nitratireducens DSM 15102]
MKIVLALGGNALQSDPKDTSVEAQLKNCRETAKAIVDIVEEGHTLAIVHGNGPQVGQIIKTVNDAHASDKSNILYPLDVCGAFSQGYIGYHLQNTIQEELRRRNINKNVGTIVTQVEVNPKDPAFENPTKPIGSFYAKEEAEKLMAEKGYIMKEDAGRGYRRVVASPKPVNIIEKGLIKDLVEGGSIIISCGGGGIPVIKTGQGVKGIAAVIDKDFAAEKLAEMIDADQLVILTAVDKVCINFNKPSQQELSQVTMQELNQYIKEGQFAPGSMLPKVEACKKFVIFNPNKKAIIASLENAKEAIKGNTGTTIVYK